MVEEAQLLRRPRPVSAQQTVARYLNDQLTSHGRVVYRSASLAHPPPTRSSTSMTSQPSTSTEDLRWWLSRKDSVSPSIMKNALERFQSLDALSTTSTTTPLRRGSPTWTPTFNATWMTLPTSHPAPDDARQVATRRGPFDHDTASEYKAAGLRQRYSNDTPKDTTEDWTPQLDPLPHFEQALTKFRSMEDVAQTAKERQGGVLLKPGVAGRLLPRTLVVNRRPSARENWAASLLSSSSQQINHQPSANSNDVQRTTPPNRTSSSTSPELEVSRLSALPEYQSLCNISTDPPLPSIVRLPPSSVPTRRRLPRWPPRNVSVSPSASRRAFSVSNDVAAAVNDDEVDLHPRTTMPPSRARTVASPSSQSPVTEVEVATVEDVPETMKSSLYVQLKTTRRVTSSQCRIRVLTRHHHTPSTHVLR